MLIGFGVWLRFQDDLLIAVALICPMVGLCAVSSIRRHAVWAVCAVIAGIAATEWRMNAVAAPVLADAWRGDVAGRVRVVDAAISGAPRLTLDHVSMAGIARVPLRVRVSIRRGGALPRIGDLVRVSAVLDAPRGAAEPGGYDFSRQAYFDRLGAVGYAVGRVETEPVAGDALPLALRIDRVRGAIAAALRAQIEGPEGAIAAALTVGDRSGIPAETRDALRDSGLAHLLAISGLHVGLLGGLVYWVVRLVLAVPPQLSERFAIRKVAAGCALVAVAVYLVMSGAGVATQRAFIMAAVALCAIMIDRAAVTMRGLAVAATIILVFRPESLFEAGFQMSFAAVAALVAGYDATRDFWRERAQRHGIVARLVTGFLATTMTSLLAGLATAPFAAYHFNRLVIWGLPANLLATPLMGVWIMPCIILAAILVPLGLEGMALIVLGIGIRFILAVATWFGGLDGAVAGVMAASPLVLFGVVFGGLWLVIWRGPVRFAGLLPVLAGLALWTGGERPDLFIARDAALIAGRGEDGQIWVSRRRAEKYAAQTWLRRDGEARPDRNSAYKRREWSCTARRCRGWTGDDWRIVYLRKGEARPEDCLDKMVLIAPHLTSDPASGCLFLGRDRVAGASGMTVTFPPKVVPTVRRAQSWAKKTAAAFDHPE